MTRCFSIAAPALLVAACAAQYPPAANPSQPTGERARECPIMGSSDWAAWVSAMPGPGARPELKVTGKVTVPTGGYTFAWRDLRVMESYPVQIVAELEALPPDGPATQAVVTHDLEGTWPADPPIGSVTVTCGGRSLARISSVETAR